MSTPQETDGNKVEASDPEQEVIPPKVEDIVTPDILTAIIADYNKRHSSNAILVDWEAKPGTVAGDNYMSLIYIVNITLKNGQHSQTLPVVLKVLPRNEVRVKLINEGNIFVKEIHMYDKIIPAMEQFQRETRKLPESEVCNPWPLCFAYKTDGKGDFLAMENLKSQGYKMASRQNGLDFEHCKLVLENMARFHAVSYAMFSGDYDKILEQYPWLEETIFREDKIPPVWKDMLSHTYQQQAVALKAAGEDLGAHLLENIYGEDYFKELNELMGVKRRWAVIGHGDCWTNNILFRYDEETGKPLDLKFVDYQVTRVASRAVDFHYFLYSSPQMQVLNEREAELRQIYFDEFTRFAKRLGVDVEAQELTKDNFEQEIDLIRYYGVVTGFFLALVTSADSADVPEMENIKEEDFQDSEKTKSYWLNMMKEKGLAKVTNLAAVHLPKCPQMKKFLP